MTAFEFIKSLKTGKTTRKEWEKIIGAINKKKLNEEILNGIHVGLGKLSDRELKLIAEEK